ncbi:MAG: hypothetical protein IKU62_08145 [Ruminiclostridium sp.]|nr:hypothetical protein [Ruminiclostridium sp.]
MKRLLPFLLLLTLLVPMTATADTGPKPSVTVTFQGLEDPTYYVTLLSERDSTGPWSHSQNYEEYYGDQAVWEALNSYEDPDGFYFLGCYEDCSETHTFSWTYYPPQVFKVLVYFPESDTFAVTDDTYERYAFHSYFKCNAGAAPETGLLAPLHKDYLFGEEILSFLARVVITLAAEMALAFVFGFRAKEQLKVIFWANLATQVILNLALNLINYKFGGWAFVFGYLWMEAAVFLLEGWVYAATLRKLDRNPEEKRHPWAYAFTANTISLLLGLFISQHIPGIF